MVTLKAMNGPYLNITQCANGEERRRRRLSEEEIREISERAFKAYNMPLATVTSFK